MRNWWQWIEERLLEPLSNLKDNTRRVLGILKGPVVVAGKGKNNSENAVISYQIYQWTPHKETIYFANAAISLTGLSVGHWMQLYGRALIYRIFLMCHESNDSRPQDPDHIEQATHKEKVHPYPPSMWRYERADQVRYFTNKSWVEKKRIAFKDAATQNRTDIDPWLQQSLIVDEHLEAASGHTRVVVELEYTFDRSVAPPAATATMARVSKTKTILRESRPGETLLLWNFPHLKYGPD